MTKFHPIKVYQYIHLTDDFVMGEEYLDDVFRTVFNAHRPFSDIRIVGLTHCPTVIKDFVNE